MDASKRTKALAALIASILALFGGVLLGVGQDGSPIIGEASTETVTVSTDTLPTGTITLPTDTATVPTDTTPTTATVPPVPAPWDIDQTDAWHCTHAIGTPDQPYRVRVRQETNASGAVNLDDGCTGYLEIDVYTQVADGVKVHHGAHDLVVSGMITCDGKRGTVHQDGIQAQDGDRVTFLGMRIDCPTGNNGGLFIEKKHPSPGEHLPTDIVCDGCNVNNANAAIHIGPDSIRSGARDSLLHLGTGDSSPADCVRSDPKAQDPVNDNNVCVP